jgi:hypothetical protein
VLASTAYWTNTVSALSTGVRVMHLTDASMNYSPRRFVSPKPQPRRAPAQDDPVQLRRRSKRERRDRLLLRALAIFLVRRRWAPSAPELAAVLKRDRVTTWRGLARLRENGLARMRQRATWEPTNAGWGLLDRSPIGALIESKPRRREHRIAAVQRTIRQIRLDTHLTFVAARRLREREEGLPCVE